MTNAKEQARKYLEGVRAQAAKLLELEELAGRYYYPQAVRFHDAPGGGNISTLDNAAEMIEKARRSIEVQRMRTIARKAEANAIIMQLDKQTHRQVLRAYYVDAAPTWDAVANTLGMEAAHARHLNAKALQAFGEVLQERTKDAQTTHSGND